MFTPPNLNTLGHISIQEPRTCLGVAKKTGLPCRNLIAHKNVEKAIQYVQYELGHHHGNSSQQAELQWLAGLLLCRRNHQNYIYEVSQFWLNQARPCPAPGKNLERKAPKTEDNLDVKESKQGKKNGSDHLNTTTRRNQGPIPVSKSSLQIRSMTARIPGRGFEDDNVSRFVEYRKTRRHLAAVNADVFKIILAHDQKKTDNRLGKKAKESGHIYAFTRSTSPGYVKIGMTVRDADVRLKEWERKCKYVPKQETHADGRMTPNVYQVEKLILAELALWRRKESPCNGGEGCLAVHREWVEVDVDLALEVINRWCSWAQKRPYDEDGVLRKEWREHTRVSVRAASVDEREQGDRWQEWIDSLPDQLPARPAEQLPTPIKTKREPTKPNVPPEDRGRSPALLSQSCAKEQLIKHCFPNTESVPKFAFPPRPNTDSFLFCRSSITAAV